MYEFSYGIHAAIIEKHKTINKPVRRSALWQAVLTAEEKNPASLNTTATKQPHSGEARKEHKAGV